MRGAQQLIGWDPYKPRGTSPLAWSSERFIESGAVFVGDISTCVELRIRKRNATTRRKGHLHLRGAQGALSGYTTVAKGTSPLAWSSVNRIDDMTL